MTTTSHSELVNRLRIVQNMRSILIQPPSDELRLMVSKQLAEETNPEMRAFLNLMVTENQGNREIAATVFKNMADQLLSDEAANYPEASPSESAPAAPEAAASLAVDPADPVVIARTIAEMEAVAAVIDNRVTTDPVATATPPPAVKEAVPFYEVASGLETTSWALTEPGQDAAASKTYSIIRTETPASVFEGVTLTHLTGLIFGIAGQPYIASGFGFACPLSEKQFAVPTEKDPRCTLKIKLSLPNALAVWDEHALVSSPSAMYYHALYQAMALGYQVLVDLEIIPYKGGYVCSLSKDIRIEHSSGSVRVADLNLLTFAVSQLTFAGFTAEAIAHD